MVSVSNITVTRVNDTAVMITWRALTLNEARGFPSYVVIVMNKCEQVSTQSTTSTSVVAGGLMPHTEYTITVQALTAGGTKEGPQSEAGETDSAQRIYRRGVATVIHSWLCLLHMYRPCVHFMHMLCTFVLSV